MLTCQNNVVRAAVFFFAAICSASATIVWPNATLADGKLVPPRNYKGSLEERAQEAIIIFHGSDKAGDAAEDLILKIKIEGKADEFAWVIPFPNEPKVAKEDPKLFQELFNYVEARKYALRQPKSGGVGATDNKEDERPLAAAVEVLSRQIVGDFEVAVVRENEAGGLNPWLEKEGYQRLEDADDVLEFYRDKKYVFACIKVSSKAAASQGTFESHPLRFTFDTGGRDGIYFPMKMTGLQSAPFDVNLYVFYRFWLNDKLSQFGYRHRGFTLNYRDWDTRDCEPNGGKAYTLPEEDPFLKGMERRIPTVTDLIRKLHPGEKYYLTNIQAHGLKPDDVREWNDDLWLFPYYTNREFVPYDARPGGPAASAYPHANTSPAGSERSRSSGAAATSGGRNASNGPTPIAVILSVAAAFMLGLFALVVFRLTRRPSVIDYGSSGDLAHHARPRKV